MTAGNDQTKPDKAGTLSQTGSLEQQPAPKITEAKSPVIATAATPPKNDFKNAMPADADEEQSLLVIQATEETWIRIQGDDKEPVQVLLKSGEKISHKAGRFSMDIGNAGGIRIQFNGKNIENLGKSGQVIHLRLP